MNTIDKTGADAGGTTTVGSGAGGTAALKARVREAGFQAMRIKPINTALRTVARPLRDRLPWGVVHSIPMIGDIEVDLEDGRQIVLVSDGYDSLASRMYWSGIDGFEPESLRLFLHLSGSAEVVFDVGAHIGLYALLAAAHRPDVSAYAFEPVERNLGYLETNVARNGSDNITVVKAAVGSDSGTVVLHVPDTLRLPATASIEDHAAAVGKPVEVPLVSLDGYVAEHSIGRLDLLKIDVEGAQYDVLRGAKGVIAEHRPAIICEVLKGFGEKAEIEDLLRANDYRFFLMTDEGLIEHAELEGDPTYFFKNYLLIPASDMDRLPDGAVVSTLDGNER